MRQAIILIVLVVLLTAAFSQAVEVQISRVQSEIWETGFSDLFTLNIHNNNGDQIISCVDLDFEYLPDGDCIRLDPQRFRLNAGGNQVAYVRDGHICIDDLQIEQHGVLTLLFDAGFMGGYGFFSIHLQSIIFSFVEEGEEVVVLDQDTQHWLRNPEKSYELVTFIRGMKEYNREMTFPLGAEISGRTYCWQVEDNCLEPAIVAVNSHSELWEYEEDGVFVLPSEEEGSFRFDPIIRDELDLPYWNFADGYRAIDHPQVVKSAYASAGILNENIAEEVGADDGGRLLDLVVSSFYYEVMDPEDLMEGRFSFRENVELCLTSSELEENGFREPVTSSMRTTVDIFIRSWVIGDVDGDQQITDSDVELLLDWMLWEDHNELWLTSEGPDAIRGKVSYNGLGFTPYVSMTDAYYLQNRNLFGEELGIGVPYSEFYHEERGLNVDSEWELDGHELFVETEGNAIQALAIGPRGEILWSESCHIREGQLLSWPYGRREIQPLVSPTRDGGTLFRISPEIDLDGATIEVRAMRLEGILNNIETSKIIPTDVELLSAYPNPFNSSTRINFVATPTGQLTTLSIFDANGRKVDFLSGINSVVWEANAFPAGNYFLQINAPNKILTKKITLVK